jgi:hypothetical protein
MELRHSSKTASPIFSAPDTSFHFSLSLSLPFLAGQGLLRAEEGPLRQVAGAFVDRGKGKE